MPDISNKKALIVVAYQDFQDHELQPVKNYLSMFGAKVDIASSTLGSATGKFGSHLEVDYVFSDIHPDDYDAVIFIGGPGALSLEENQDALTLAKGAFRSCQVLAAICIAPLILAKAGVLANRKATVFAEHADDKTIQALTTRQAKYIDKEVVIDGKLITANSPQAAEEFARTIVDALAS